MGEDSHRNSGIGKNDHHQQQDPSDRHSSFYLYEEDADSADASIQLPKRTPNPKNRPQPKINPQNLSVNVPRNNRRPLSHSYNNSDSLSLTPTSSNSSLLTPLTSSNTARDTAFKNLEDILKFPIESSHAYSYAHLSPNSLALRLNVLKRSLEILKDRPGLFKSINLIDEEGEKTDVHLAPLEEDSSGRRLSIYSTSSNNSNSNIPEPSSILPPPPSNPLYKHTNNSSEFFNDHNKKYKLQANASSAALAALFRPQMRRSDSFPVNQMYGKDEPQQTTDKISDRSNSLSQPYSRKTSAPTSSAAPTTHDYILNDDLKDIITLLENDKETLSKHKEIASNLHDLSLSTNHSDTDQRLKQDILKNKLLYALATPFIENSTMTSSLLQNNGVNTPTRTGAGQQGFASTHPSTVALSSLASANNNSNANTSNNSNRPFHSISSGKHALPQSIFTVAIDNPWSVKAANDLACLMFGVSKNMIRSLTLMDLIAPQFRNFVTERLTNYISRNLDLSLRSKRSKSSNDNPITNNNILFAGEIVAILRPGDQNYAWTSMWAKRKGDLIICMFDQIPCDAFDVVISSQKHDEVSTTATDDSPSSANSTFSSLSTSPSDSSYTIDSFNEIAGELISSIDTSELSTLSDISESLQKEIGHHGRSNSSHSQVDSLNESSNKDEFDEHLDEEDEIDSEQEDELLDYYVSQDVSDSEKINQKRYFTLQFKGNENIPCAITSNPLEINQDRYEIKLKIHTLPYIAGIFVVDSSSYRILSCNNAIAKNLFGRSSDELNDKSIDTLIPNFTKILKTGLEHNSISFQLTPGLVLPEHFFRRYDAYLRSDASPDKVDVEDLFFKSHGVQGLHRDGKMIYVDIQTRAATNGTLVIWITYSRSANKSNLTKELDKLSSTTSSIALNEAAANSQYVKDDQNEKKDVPPNFTLSDTTSKPREKLLPPTSRHEKNEVKHSRSATTSKNISSWPSQLSLFTRHKEDSLNFAPSAPEINRQSSTRKARNDSFGIPVSRLNYSIEKPRALSKLYDSKAETEKPSVSKYEKESGDEIKERSRKVSNSTFNEKATSKQSLESDSKTQIQAEETDAQPSSPKFDHQYYKKFSEEEILKLETDMINEKIAQSTHWPSVVGTKRRTKKFTEFKVLKDMGEGAYGKVVLAQHNDDPIYKIIIKCIDKERILVDTWVRDRSLGTIPSEIQVMAFLNNSPHPNIMRIIDFFEDSKYYYLETPIFGDPPAIDLFDYIEVKKDMTEIECQFIFKQIVSSIYHLHKNGIVHRDIKDENIIVDESGIIKLIDFGSAGYTKQGPFDVFVGTIDYASPEVLRGEKYEGKAQDVWALGILLYTMLYKENPFYNVDEIMEGDLRIPYVVSEGSMALVKKILVRDLDSRPSITDIVEDEWLRI